MTHLRKKFESWYLSFPDADESLLAKDEAQYVEIIIDGMWIGFLAGYAAYENDPDNNI